MTEAMTRELREEIGITATELQASFTQQSSNIDDGMTYFNAFFEVDRYTGTISNNEIDKCSELLYLSFDALKDEKVVPYVLQALEHIRDGKIFSEIQWSIQNHNV